MGQVDRACDESEYVKSDTVLFLARNMHLGGAERALLLYLNHVAALRPVLLLLSREGRLLSELRSDLPVFHVAGSAEAAAYRGRVHQVTTLLQECRRLRAVVTDTGAAVVSSFLMRSHIVALLTKIALRARVRVVLNVHEHMTESAAYLYPTWIDRALMRAITRYLFPRADRIVAVAEGVKQDLVTNFAIPAERITVVHNPIDTQNVQQRARDGPTPLGGAVGRRWVIAVGRLVPLKGYDCLIEAFARLPPSLDAGLAIVGDGPERPRLEALIRRLGLGDRARLVEAQSNPWRYMAQAELLVLSSFTEAFPNVFGEAMALRLPILSTDCGAGVREYLEDGRSGLLVPPGDAAALADGLRRLLTEGELRRRLVDHGRQRVAALDLPRAVRAYERLLTDVVKA